MLTPLLVAATALLTSLALTPVATRLAIHFGVVDLPGPRKVHVSPMPLLGGLAIYAGTVLAITLFAVNFDATARIQALAIVTAATLMVVVGSLDDRGLLHHQIKLFVAMPVAAVILIAAGMRATVFETTLGASSPWNVLDVVLTMFWVVGITAAFSILDHMDGLCAGVAAIGAAFFLYFSASSGQILVGTLAAAVLGAATGFLKWNFNPARIFMGDGGAMFLGFMMATLGLKLRLPELGALKTSAVPVLILAVPIFDTTLVCISRTRRGLLPFSSPGKDHTSHRLVGLGLSHSRAVVAVYAGGFLGGAAAYAVSRSSTEMAGLIAGAAVVAGLAGIAFLERCEFERQGRPVKPAAVN